MSKNDHEMDIKKINLPLYHINKFEVSIENLQQQVWCMTHLVICQV